jgi:hypothetical protein
MMVAAVGQNATSGVVAAASREMSFDEPAARGAVAGTNTTRDWTMILVGVFLIIAITGRRARTMFD